MKKRTTIVVLVVSILLTVMLSSCLSLAASAYASHHPVKTEKEQSNENEKQQEDVSQNKVDMLIGSVPATATLIDSHTIKFETEEDVDTSVIAGFANYVCENWPDVFEDSQLVILDSKNAYLDLQKDLTPSYLNEIAQKMKEAGEDIQISDLADELDSQVLESVEDLTPPEEPAVQEESVMQEGSAMQDEPQNEDYTQEETVIPEDISEEQGIVQEEQKDVAPQDETIVDEGKSDSQIPEQEGNSDMQLESFAAVQQEMLQVLQDFYSAFNKWLFDEPQEDVEVETLQPAESEIEVPEQEYNESQIEQEDEVETETETEIEPEDKVETEINAVTEVDTETEVIPETEVEVAPQAEEPVSDNIGIFEPEEEQETAAVENFDDYIDENYESFEFVVGSVPVTASLIDSRVIRFKTAEKVEPSSVADLAEYAYQNWSDGFDDSKFVVVDTNTSYLNLAYSITPMDFQFVGQNASEFFASKDLVLFTEKEPEEQVLPETEPVSEIVEEPEDEKETSGDVAQIEESVEPVITEPITTEPITTEPVITEPVIDETLGEDVAESEEVVVSEESTVPEESAVSEETVQPSAVEEEILQVLKVLQEFYGAFNKWMVNETQKQEEQTTEIEDVSDVSDQQQLLQIPEENVTENISDQNNEQSETQLLQQETEEVGQQVAEESEFVEDLETLEPASEETIIQNEESTVPEENIENADEAQQSDLIEPVVESLESFESQVASEEDNETEIDSVVIEGDVTTEASGDSIIKNIIFSFPTTELKVDLEKFLGAIQEGSMIQIVAPIGSADSADSAEISDPKTDVESEIVLENVELEPEVEEDEYTDNFEKSDSEDNNSQLFTYEDEKSDSQETVSEQESSLPFTFDVKELPQGVSITITGNENESEPSDMQFSMSVLFDSSNNSVTLLDENVFDTEKNENLYDWVNTPFFDNNSDYSDSYDWSDTEMSYNDSEDTENYSDSTYLSDFDFYIPEFEYESEPQFSLQYGWEELMDSVLKSFNDINFDETFFLSVLDQIALWFQNLIYSILNIDKDILFILAACDLLVILILAILGIGKIAKRRKERKLDKQVQYEKEKNSVDDVSVAIAEESGFDNMPQIVENEEVQTEEESDLESPADEESEKAETIDSEIADEKSDLSTSEISDTIIYGSESELEDEPEEEPLNESQFDEVKTVVENEENGSLFEVTTGTMESEKEDESPFEVETESESDEDIVDDIQEPEQENEEQPEQENEDFEESDQEDEQEYESDYESEDEPDSSVSVTPEQNESTITDKNINNVVRKPKIPPRFYNVVNKKDVSVLERSCKTKAGEYSTLIAQLDADIAKIKADLRHVDDETNIADAEVVALQGVLERTKKRKAYYEAVIPVLERDAVIYSELLQILNGDRVVDPDITAEDRKWIKKICNKNKPAED